MPVELDQDRVIVLSDSVSLRHLQTCQVPRRQLPEGFKSGDLVVLSLKGADLLCKLIGNDSNDCVVASNVVARRSSDHKKVLRIEKVEEQPVEIDSLELDVLLDEGNCLNLGADALATMVLYACEMLTLCNGFDVDLSSLEVCKEWAILRLERIETNTEGKPGVATPETNIRIRNIRFGHHSASDHSRPIAALGGLQSTQSCIEAEIRNRSRGNSNILLIGPSGSGKTALIESLATSLDTNLFRLESRTSPVPGENGLAQHIEKIIRLSGLSQRLSIVLIEDIEQFCLKGPSDRRGAVEHSILEGFDRFSSCPGVIIVCTTRNVEAVSPNLRRPGRLDREIYFKVPTEHDRKDMVTKILGQFQPIDDSLIDCIVARTPAFVGGDILSLLSVARRYSSTDGGVIGRTDIGRALLTVSPASVRTNTYLVERDPSMTLDALGGLLELKRGLEIAIFKPLKHPSVFRRFNLSMPKGILMYGPPGCAKTTVAKCLANEMNRHLIAISAAQIYSPYVGDSEKLLAQVFHQARMCAPSIIFIDEIDSIVGSRATDQKKHGGGGGGASVQTKLLSTLLIEMDGVGVSVQANLNAENHILVIGATNRPDMIDDALMRPGRFDRKIFVPAPNESERQDILRKITVHMPLASDVDLSLIGEETKNYSGADLINLCNETALGALARDQTAQEVSMSDFLDTLNTLKPSLTSAQLQWYEEYSLRH